MNKERSGSTPQREFIQTRNSARYKKGIVRSIIMEER